MTTEWTETEPTEQDEALYEAVATVLEDLTGYHRDGQVATMLNTLEPVLADMKRHAAAEALKQQAAALRRVRLGYLKTMLGYPHDSDAYRLTRARAGQASADAVRLDNAAQDLIAEGWEHTCYATWAATRDDPGYGCDTPVETEGDYCSRHEPEDDEDRWAD